MKKIRLAAALAFCLSVVTVLADPLTELQTGRITMEQISLPALIEGNASERAQVRQLNHNIRQALGVRHKDELIVRIGLDGTITLYGAEGHGFKVEDISDGVIPEKGVINKIAITTIKNSPVCNSIIFGGKKYWYPSPDCPH